MTAKLFEGTYRPAEGFQEDNIWYVTDESLLAESDTKLVNGWPRFNMVEWNFRSL
ncbi:MAG: hypothetical protein WCS42_08065 [Verrucomicrobiota bacterium]